MEEKSQGEGEREWPRDEKEEAWVVAGVRWPEKMDAGVHWPEKMDAGVRWPEKMEVLAPWAERREKEGGKGTTI